MYRKILLFLIIFPSLVFSQLTNIKDKTKSQLGGVVVGTTNIASKDFLDDQIFQRMVELSNASLNRAYNVQDYASLTAALTDVNDDSATLIISSSISITSNTTISEKAAVIVNRNGRFNITSGDTLTINTYFYAGTYQVFEGSGEVRFGDNVRLILPEWFGVVGDGSIDNEAAIERAIRSSNSSTSTNGKTIQFSEGDYIVNAEIDIEMEYLTIRGAAGRFATRIKTTNNVSIFDINAKDYITIENMILEAPATGDTAATLKLTGSSNFFYGRNLLITGGRFNMQQSGGNYAIFERCDFSSADSAGVFWSDIEGGGFIGMVLRDCRILTQDTFGLYSNTGDAFSIDNLEISQVDTTALFMDSGTGVGDLRRIDISAGQAGFKIKSVTSGLRISDSWYESASGTLINTIGLEIISTSNVQINNVHIVSVLADSNGVGLKLTNSNEIQISNSVFSGDSIAVWLTGSSTGNNFFSNVIATNSEIHFVENSSAHHNRYVNCYAKTLEASGEVGFSLANTSSVIGGVISGSTDSGAEDPFVTGEGYVHLFTANDATPDVVKGTIYRTANTSTTTITAFDNANSIGKNITVLINDSFTRFDVTGTTLKHHITVDFAADSLSVISWVWDGTNWFCTQSDTL